MSQRESSRDDTTPLRDEAGRESSADAAAGPRRFSDPDGNLVGEEYWSNGTRQGLAKYYFPGSPRRLFAIGEYASGHKTGLWERWHENGALASRGQYEYSAKRRAAVRVGDWDFFQVDGTKDTSRSGRYEDGRRMR